MKDVSHSVSDRTTHDAASHLRHFDSRVDIVYWQRIWCCCNSKYLDAQSLNISLNDLSMQQRDNDLVKTTEALPKLFYEPKSHGFINLDRDGVLRSWSDNGTVLDAAKLTQPQIDSYFNLQAASVDPKWLDREKKLLAGAGTGDAALDTESLYHPAESIWPLTRLKMISGVGNTTPVNSVLGGRDVEYAQTCVAAYCSQHSDCAWYVGCWVCYGTVCYG